MNKPLIASPLSLRQQVDRLEQQMSGRRLHVRTLAAGAKQKTAARLASPVTLLAAFGTGVALEKMSHGTGKDGKWTLSDVLDVTFACIRLLMLAADEQSSTPDKQDRAPAAVSDESGRR